MSTRTRQLGRRISARRLWLATVCALLLSVAESSGQPALTISPPTLLNSNADADTTENESLQLSTNDRGVWIAVWESCNDLGGTLGEDWDILAARSTDNGATWSEPTPLNTNADSDSGHDRDCQIAADGQGVWIAVWYSYLSSPFGHDWDILLTRSTDDGATWSDPMPLNANADSDGIGYESEPKVFTDGHGVWIVVWRSSDDLGETIGRDYDILMVRSSDDGHTWSDPTPLNADADSDSRADWAPSLTPNEHGNWVATWSAMPEYSAELDSFMAGSADNGVTWTVPVPFDQSFQLYDDGQYHHWYDSVYVQVISAGIGRYGAAWRLDYVEPPSFDGFSDIMIASSVNNGASWEVLARLTAADCPTQCDDVALRTDGQGNWLLTCTTWQFVDEDYEYAIIVVASHDDGETWTEATELYRSTYRIRSHQLVTDTRGNCAIAWSSVDDLNGTIGWDADILMLYSTDDGATWSGPVPLNSDAAADDVSDRDPVLIADSHGNWLVVWQSRRHNVYYVRAAHFALPDCNENLAPDHDDIADGVSTDCNENGVPDECDLATGVLNDADADGVPDECEPDCNENGVPDDMDIADGTSEDRNTNGIPDECESDCNENGVPDDMDIADGTSEDRNTNGIPDECEPDCNENGAPDDMDIADGTSEDRNTNGIPDECEATPFDPCGILGLGSTTLLLAAVLISRPRRSRSHL